MCILPRATPPATCPAHDLTAPQRQDLAVQTLAGTQPVSHLARQHHVSRKFVYQQADKAAQALQHAFDPGPEDDRALFHLPVTQAWLRQLILGLVLIGHSPLRGVLELLRDLFDLDIALGTVHAVVHSAVAEAGRWNSGQNLAGVRIGALDELFQGRQPVLVGADVASSYCFLLSLEEQRDAETWGIRLLELQDRGFAPDSTIADFGSGLRAGQELASPGLPCRGDVFHALHEVQQAVTFLENRAYQAIEARSKLERKQAGHRRRKGRANPNLSQKLRYAHPAEARALALADDLATLARWLREDLFAVNGLAYPDRCALYDFVVAELRARMSLCPHRLGPLYTLLHEHRDDLLAFAAQLDLDLAHLAEQVQVPLALVRQALDVERIDPRQARRWPREAAVREQLRGRFHVVREAVAEVARRAVRASSVIENLNSRLRSYFFLRRSLGPDYLKLLQFFLNHRRFLRSEHPERVDRSPAELLTGQRHPHWLEMLGYRRFSRN